MSRAPLNPSIREIIERSNLTAAQGTEAPVSPRNNPVPPITREGPAFGFVQSQRLLTPLNEQGIDCEPERPSSLNIEPGIRRVFASLFAKDGMGNRRLVCDAEGRLMVNSGAVKARALINTATQPIVALTPITDIALDNYDYFVAVVLSSNCVAVIRDAAGVETDRITPNVQAVQTGFGSNIQFFTYEGRGRQIEFVELANIAGSYQVWYYRSSL